jgi:sugar O-acyltransferase (sialic acid O-acetyltransferase NeuD family)
MSCGRRRVGIDAVTLAPLVLIGAGGHAAACIDVIEREGRFRINGLIGRPEDVGQQVLGYSVIGTDEDLPKLLSDNSNVLITVGQIETAELRRTLFDRVVSLGATLPVVVSSGAYVSPHARIDRGTIVMHGAVVNAGARIGANCIVNTLALVEHDCEIGDHCHVSTTAVLNGGVRVGAGTFVGSAASVRQGIRIGESCVIGMGQVVVKDCPAGSRFPQPRPVA